MHRFKLVLVALVLSLVGCSGPDAQFTEEEGEPLCSLGESEIAFDEIHSDAGGASEASELGTLEQGLSGLTISPNFGFCGGNWPTQYNTGHTGSCVMPDKLPVVLKVTDAGTGEWAPQFRQAVDAAANDFFNNGAVIFVYEGTSGAGGRTADIELDLEHPYPAGMWAGAAPVTLTTHTPAPNGPRGTYQVCRIRVDAVQVNNRFRQFFLYPSLYAPNFTIQQVADIIVKHEIAHCLGASHSSYGAGNSQLMNVLSPHELGGANPQTVQLEPVGARFIPGAFRGMLEDYLQINNAVLPE